MQPTALGKIKLLEESDLPALQIFCEECGKLGWENNKDFKAIKLDKTVMPNGQFFIAVDGDKIYSLAGVQKLPEINDHAWRCLFRGAQLPGYTPQWSMNIFKSGLHFGYFLFEQIKFIQEHDPLAEFYISTNTDSKMGAKSSRMDSVIMPRVAKTGIWSLHSRQMLYGVEQNIWKINVDEYLRQRMQNL